MMSQATDAKLAQLSRRLAGRLMLDLARSGPARGRGVGRIVSVPASRSDGDVDLDQSMDAIVSARADRRPPHLDELAATAWQQPETAICLVVDRSGSMSGERLAGAGLGAALCAWKAPRQFSVLVFSNTVVAIKSIEQFKPAEQVVAEVLSLRGHGTTDVDLALRGAHHQLATTSAARKLTILLSDAEATTGNDPTPAARALDELAIIAPHDASDHATQLARATGARLSTVGSPFTVLQALQAVLG